jgi:hypothetical protein
MEAFFENVLLDPMKQFLESAAAFVPNLLTGFILLILGLLVAWFVKHLMIRFLRVIQVDSLFEKSGMAGAFRNLGIKDSLSGLLSRIAYWMVALIFLTMALDALKTPAIEEFLSRFFLYLPNVFVAVIVIVIGYLVGNFLGRATLIASVNANLPISSFLARFVKITVYITAASMALELLGIGKDTVLVAFAIVFGGIVLAFAIAFGLGAQDAARKYLEKKLEEKEGKPDDISHI